MAKHPEWRGIKPHSLKVAAISAIMEEVAKGNANFHRCAIMGSCRSTAARDMAGNLFAKRRASTSLRVEIRTIGFPRYQFSTGVGVGDPAFLEIGDDS